MTDESARLQTVTSPDGTSIALHVSGEGPPLLLIHGALSDHAAWDMVAFGLEDRRELLAMDRRGFGVSGVSAEYKPELEVDDLFAAAMGLHREVDVLAHSSGAVIALRAAERGLPIRRMILYEPPVMQLRIESRLPRDLPARIEGLLATGDREGALELFLRHGPQLGDQEIAGLRTSRRWPSLVEMAPTVAYDVHVVSEYRVDRQRLATVKAPVLFLYGSMSPPWYRRGIEAIDHLLPNSRVRPLPGQGHNAMFSGPDLLTAVVMTFLEEPVPDVIVKSEPSLFGLTGNRNGS